MNSRKSRGEVGMVEKVRCFKDNRSDWVDYYFVYGDNAEKAKGELTGFLYFIDGETEISIKDDSLVVPQIIELMYDCCEDKKSFKIKF